MGEFTADELAVRAEVDRADVDRIVGLGVVVADADGLYSSGHVRRVRILRALERSGLSIAGIAEAVRRGFFSLDFADLPSYERFDPLGDQTFDGLSVESGVAVELLLTTREAMGFAQPHSHDRVGQDEREVVPLIRFMLDHNFRQPVIERALRTYGESVRRVAETEADWWNSEIQRPMLERGASTQEMVDMTAEIVDDLSVRSDRALLALFHGQQANQWMRNILSGVEAMLTAAGLHEPVDRPPAICFLDLTGYTRLTDERGDEAAADLATELARMVQRTSAQYGGTPVKWLGDGVMFHFPRPAQGVAAALDMVEGAVRVGLPPAHVGLHAGPVIFQAGDYFGRTVNLASRIADYARPGEVLVSQEVVDASAALAGDRDGVGGSFSFALIGPVDLKGVADPVRLYAVRRNA